MVKSRRLQHLLKHPIFFSSLTSHLEEGLVLWIELWFLCLDWLVLYRNKITQSVKIWSKWAMGFIYFFAYAVLSGIQTCREVKLFPKLLVHFVKMQVSNNQHNWPKHHITCKLFYVFETMFKMMFFCRNDCCRNSIFLNQFEMFVLFTNNNIYCIFTKCSNFSFSTIFVSVLGVGCFLVTSKVGGLYIPLCVCGFFPSTLKCLSKCRDTTDKRATAVLNTNCCFN